MALFGREPQLPTRSYQTATVEEKKKKPWAFNDVNTTFLGVPRIMLRPPLKWELQDSRDNYIYIKRNLIIK